MAILQLGHGGLLSPEDPRNWTLASAGAPTAYPQKLKLDTVSMKITMQDHLGTCVNNSIEEAVRKLNGITEPLSWRFNAVLCLAFAGTKQMGPDGKIHDFTMFPKPSLDGGTYPRLAAQIASIWGMPRAEFFPNDISLSAKDFYCNGDATKIPKEAYEDALNYKIDSYYDVPVSEEGIKKALTFASQNNAWVMILRNIGDSYWTPSWKRSDIDPMPLPKNYTGGHEESLVGYDSTDIRTLIKWMNHWSSAWCSTSGKRNGTKPEDMDGGYCSEYLDIWLKNIYEITVVVKDLKPNPDFTYHFTQILKLGMQGPNVVALQHALTIDGTFTYSKFTGYFGPITQKAVMDFQRKHNVASESEIISANGQVGPKTLQVLNNIFNK